MFVLACIKNGFKNFHNRAFATELKNTVPFGGVATMFCNACEDGRAFE